MLSADATLVQHLKCSVGVVNRQTVGHQELYLQGFKIPGVRTLILHISYTFALDTKDIQDPESFFKEQHVLQIPFTLAFNSTFNIQRLPIPVIDVQDSLGPFGNPDSPLEKTHEWIYTCRSQNTTKSVTEVKSVLIEPDVSFVRSDNLIL